MQNAFSHGVAQMAFDIKKDMLESSDIICMVCIATVVPTKSYSGVIFCLQLLSKTLTCTPHLRLRELIVHLCINPIL